MKFSIILAAAAVAAGVNAQVAYSKTTLTVYETFTKFQPTKITITETATVTKHSTLKITETETVTKYSISHVKATCSATATKTVSVGYAPTVKARAVADQPLYAMEFN